MIEFKENVIEFYSQFEDSSPVLHETRLITDHLEALERDMKSIGVYVFFLKWSREIFDHDPIFEYEYFLEDHKLPENYIYFSERQLYFASVKEEAILFVKHHLSKEVIPRFNEILVRYFPHRTLGYQQESEAITIYFALNKPSNGPRKRLDCLWCSSLQTQK
jgi:hypothetical protein